MVTLWKPRRNFHFALRRAANTKSSRSALFTLGAGTSLFLGISALRRFSRLHAAESELSKQRSAPSFDGGHMMANLGLDALQQRFQKFASACAKNGEPVMTQEDFIRSLLPEGSNDTVKLDEGARRLFGLADVNRDGTISFPEYVLFLTFLTQPEANFRIAFMLFDNDRDGRISLDDFKKILAAYRQPGMDFDFEKSELLRTFFGDKGDKTVTIEDFAKFVRDLRHEIWKQEFRHYDPKGTGKISYKDFCDIISSHMDRVPPHFQTNLSKLPWLRSGKMTYDEFEEFNEFINHLDQIRLATELYTAAGGKLSKDDFQNAVKVTTGLHVSPREVEIVYAAFDANGDGHIDMDEFENYMKRRVKYELVPSIGKQNTCNEQGGQIEPAKAK